MTGLPGVRKHTLKASWAKTTGGFLAGLRKRRCVTSAGDDGAVNVWIDDKKQFRCAFMRHLSVLEERTFSTKKEARDWLRKWLPKIHEFHS